MKNLKQWISDYDKVRMEEENNYDQLIGKWVRCVHGIDKFIIKGNWYEVAIAKDRCMTVKSGDPEDDDDGFTEGPFAHYFDLTDPRDENPDQVNTTQVPWKTEAQ